MYTGAEDLTGEIAEELGIVDDLWLATKVWIDGEAEGRAQMAQSFDELKRSRIELMQVHNLRDADIHLATLEEMKADERGVAVMLNRPFGGGELFGRFGNQPLPEWAAEIDCSAWRQVFLKYILSHPAVTCAIPATSNPDHVTENMGGGRGRLPDEELRRRMVALLD